jgi:GNAT superfamily N-acetyltransferase
MYQKAFEDLSNTWSVPMDSFLIERCQQLLVHALRARIQQTEQMVGDQFGFEIIQREVTTAFLAHHWPHAQDKPAFHRVFNFAALPNTLQDLLLERLVDEQLDAIVEVLPGKDADAAATVLRAYHYQPVWSIPWLSMPLQSVTFSPVVDALVQVSKQHDRTQLAEVLIAAYGYTGEEANAWRTFATYGYRASGFFGFLATLENQPAAAGILHMARDSALVDGAATLPAYRGRGLQKALLSARLLDAQEQGALHAFSRTSLGSISQANLQKMGMRVFTQSTAWRRI